MDARMQDAQIESEIEAYVIQYSGHSRLTRLLKIAENSHDLLVTIAAIKIANRIAKKEGLLG
jgi:hypothetical protein